MLFVILAYLAMAAPLYGCVNASLSSGQGGALVSIRFAGFRLIQYAELFDHEPGAEISTAEILALLRRRKGEGTKERRKRLRSLEKTVFRYARIEDVSINARIGLDEAWSTALAAGGLRAAALSMLSFLRVSSGALVRVVPDYASSCICVHLRCIFSVTAGDIILTTMKAAVKRTAGKGIVHAAASH